MIIEQPCDDCEETICTIASIEPENSGTRYEKYIADSCQANLLANKWQEIANATTFEDCATQADSTG